MDPLHVHSDHEVFTISGHVDGLSGDKGTFVVAESANDVATAFAGWGFTITAMSSLADVNQSLVILEALAARSPEVGPEEYVDLLPDGAGESGRREERHVFTFVGQSESARQSGNLQAGFAVAPDREFLVDYLRSMGFETYSTLSYVEARDLHDCMQRIACDQEDDEASFVNLKAM